MTGPEDELLSPDQAEVRDLNLALWTAVEEGDLDRLGAIWADGPEAAGITCVHPGWPVLRGRAEVLRSYALIMANTSYVQFFLTDVQVTLDGDVAILSCTASLLTGMGEEDGGDDTGFAGGQAVVTNIFRRKDGDWRLWLHHASPVLAEADAEDEI
ncbi:nuclear transport factor 2 family protein [Streptodolium elevatio]|uniref:Nuclear transport factor 2 family protein n=1 Tax=Streptodolium elevatio TaxID=3157996 RepID=A0ABV3DBR3_9ACTN